jgi:mannose-6-phosphate isomerase-like protein (cupin superfamily)
MVLGPSVQKVPADLTSFVGGVESTPIQRTGDHGGVGSITFRRLLASSQFSSNVDFVDYTVIPPGSTIGRHTHEGNEELYYIASGTPLVNVNGEERRLKRHDVAVVRSGQWHELRNDTADEVEIFVVQVRL